ncbi:hypothetical protein FGB62_76g0127 [Gracilaria domingensis]|nr:hypothetical protein FGB62_76g0127 [Gracilaria domingensis]
MRALQGISLRHGVLLLCFFFASSSARTAIPSTHLITSKESCLSHIECATDHYCKAPLFPSDDALHSGDDYPVFTSTCVPRLSKGSQCFPNTGVECQEGSFCGYIGGSTATPPTCVQQLSKGDDCSQVTIVSQAFGSNGAMCEGELECVNGRSCDVSNIGFEGDSCQIGMGGPCQVLNGFYCRSMVSKCAARKVGGQTCGMEPDNFECESFCVNTLDPYTRPGVCQTSQKPGQKCDDDAQCEVVPIPLRDPRTADVLCNRPSGATGICVPEGDLIKDLGASCDPTSDRCDSRRGLSCADVDGAHVCVQRGTSPNPREHFCTPRSPLSSCPPDNLGNPRECRRALSRQTKQFQGTYGCRRLREVVPHGAVCSAEEFAICEPNTVCSQVPGVEMIPSRFPPPPLSTCVKMVPVGANCSDQFRFECEEGTFCVNGACRRVGAAPEVPNTFASLSGNCTELSCPPALSCVPNPPNFGFGKSCRLPVKKVGLWQSCSTSAQFEFKCKGGLQCSHDFTGNGTRVCRPKRGVGGICTSDESCVGDLKCDPSHREHGFQRECYDPSLLLNISDACNPRPGKNSRRCVAEIQMDPSDANEWLVCLSSAQEQETLLVPQRISSAANSMYVYRGRKRSSLCSMETCLELNRSDMIFELAHGFTVCTTRSQKKYVITRKPPTAGVSSQRQSTKVMRDKGMSKQSKRSEHDHLNRTRSIRVGQEMNFVKHCPQKLIV